MADISKTIETLDALYNEYKENDSKLGAGRTKEAAKLLAEMTFAGDENTKPAAEQLARFPGDVTKAYFEKLTKGVKTSAKLLDKALEELLLCDNDSSNSMYFISKYSSAVSVIMNNCRSFGGEIPQLQRAVLRVAKSAAKANKSRGRFKGLIEATKGGIFGLDYSGAEKNSLKEMWDATNNIYPDLLICEYGEIITDWGKKYDFLKDSNSAEKSNNAPAASSTEKPHKTAPQKEAETADNNISGDLRKEIFKDISGLILPVNKSLEALKDELAKYRGTAAENTNLAVRAAELERQLSEAKSLLQKSEQDRISLKTELETLKIQKAKSDERTAELENKLKEAFDLNSQNSSMEAEKVRNTLRKDFSYLHEDWLEFADAEVSEENYESLKAIIIKVFRSLDRNGIKVKEN